MRDAIIISLYVCYIAFGLTIGYTIRTYVENNTITIEADNNG
jgi:hypothetical protein